MIRKHVRPTLPLARLAALVALVAGGAVAMPVSAADPVVVVRPGDTLGAIALANGLTVSQLVALNAISNPNRIFAGQRIRLPAKPLAPTPPAATAPTAAPQPVVHIVRPGEHLTGIARRYGTTIAAIVQANGIANPSLLRVGQHLAIPGVAAPPAAPAMATPAAATAPIVHVVGAGENLTGIARRYGTTIAAIVRANGIANPSLLRVGQHLTIPSGALPPTVSAASASPLGAPAVMAAKVAARAAIGAIIRAEAEAQGVPAAFALAVAWQESGWQAGVVSRAGAVGVMQLTPATATWVGATMLGHGVHLRDARSNVEAGIRLLRHYLARYRGDKALALAAYYQGQTAADRHGIYAMTRPYVASIMRLESIFAP